MLACLQPGVDEDTTTAPYGNTVKRIAVQCCRTDVLRQASPKEKCRRYIGKSPGGCVGGSPPEAHTYSGAVAQCAMLSTAEVPLALCDIACGGLGCGYNAFPVYSSKSCVP